MLSLNGVQRIVGVIGLRNVLDANGASDGLDLRLSNDPQNAVDVAGSNGVLDPTAGWCNAATVQEVWNQ